MNSISLVGNLVADPNCRPLRTGTACRFRLAVDHRSRDEAIFIDVDTYGGLADACADHLRKGRLVAVSGRLDEERWTQEGRNHSRHLVIASSVDFLDAPRP